MKSGMSGMVEDVRRFHEAVGGRVAEGFTPRVLRSRRHFIEEEAQEALAALCEAEDQATLGDVSTESRRHLVQELIDLTYVIMGTFAELGLDPMPAWRAVHEANMLKEPSPSGGRAIKPAGWQPPEIPLVELKGNRT